MILLFKHKWTWCFLFCFKDMFNVSWCRKLIWALKKTIGCIMSLHFKRNILESMYIRIKTKNYQLICMTKFDLFIFLFCSWKTHTPSSTWNVQIWEREKYTKKTSERKHGIHSATKTKGLTGEWHILFFLQHFVHWVPWKWKEHHHGVNVLARFTKIGNSSK